MDLLWVITCVMLVGYMKEYYLTAYPLFYLALTLILAATQYLGCWF